MYISKHNYNNQNLDTEKNTIFLSPKPKSIKIDPLMIVLLLMYNFTFTINFLKKNGTWYEIFNIN